MCVVEAQGETTVPTPEYLINCDPGDENPPIIRDEDEYIIRSNN